eukprot:TRINITY_DN11751_c0_g1_i1.p1 TRINITY_DN11751_c0_g1~~TRINITY_DN11751_c0_g1_i1.p1  ORF type:complete len:248 (-),score=66.36 TRINITY_DN11751_c0_g1_i1:60-758(-)
MEPEKDYYKDLYNGVKIVVVGDSCVGKSCFISRNVNKSFQQDYIATIRDSYDFTVVIEGKEVPVKVEDTAGHEDYVSIRPMSYKDINAYMVLFSVVSPNSFASIKRKWDEEMEHHAPGCPFIIVGTKSDLREDAATLERLKGQQPITEEQGVALAKELEALAYVETSALLEKSLSEPFERLVQSIVDARRKEADDLKELEATQTTSSKKNGKGKDGKEGKEKSGGFFGKKKK